jgi:hypothetical protein
MKRWFTFAALAALFVAGMGSIPAAQAATQPSTAQSTTGTGKAHGTFTVELTKPLDSKKLKEGDPVEAKLTGGITLANGTQVARGTRLVGHVTVATARSKGGSDSTLGIVFDKIARSGGEDTSINGVIQAVAPNPNEEVSTGAGVGYTDLKQATTAGGAPTPSKGPMPILNDQSQGVLGMKGMQLGPQGVITSTGKEVKLDTGTRILLNVTM